MYNQIYAHLLKKFISPKYHRMCVQYFGEMEMLVIVEGVVAVTEGDSDGHLCREPGDGLGTDGDRGEHRPAYQYY